MQLSLLSSEVFCLGPSSKIQISPLHAANSYADAATLYRKVCEACDAGEAIACMTFGVMLHNGESVGPDEAQALSFHRKACDEDIMARCTWLGFSYQHGQGVAADVIQSATFYRKACDGGEATGCRDLGAMYRSGLGMAVDEPQALSFYRKACDGGSQAACEDVKTMSQQISTLSLALIHLCAGWKAAMTL